MSRLSQWIREVNWENEELRNKYVFTASIDELLVLISYLRDLIEADYIIPEYNPFTYVPNNELSGTGGCSEVNCKVRRAKKFATFSAIYADDVYIQLNLITNEHFDYYNPADFDEESSFAIKYDFIADIEVILSYLELIECGVVHIEPVRKTFCKDCFQKVLLQTNNFIDITPINEYVKEKVIIEAIEYDEKNKQLVIELKNINDYFDGENLITSIKEKEDNKFPKSYKKLGIMDKTESVWNDLIEQFVENEFVSACYYTNYCRENNAKLITSKPSDGMFAMLTRGGDDVKHVLEVYKNLPQYDMPFFQNISIQKAMQLREKEGMAFDRYRIALNKAIEEQCKTNSKIEWKDIYDDILYPEFLNLDTKLNNLKDGIFKKTFGDLLIVGGIVTAGLLAGFIPVSLSGIVGALGGTTGITALGKKLKDNHSNKKAELRTNDYYYLWRLKNKL
ncbi:MAG: hypothetical protein ACK5MV_06125 [Aminipila sp.]